MKSLKLQPETTIGEEIAMQIRGAGTTFTVTMTEDLEGFETAVLYENVCNDITVIQTIDNEVKVTHLDANEIEAIKAVLL
jgi:hypothetical protein